MLDRLKMKCARITAGCAKDDYRFASDLLATIFGQKFSSARKQILLLSTHGHERFFNFLTSLVFWRVSPVLVDAREESIPTTFCPD